MTEETEVVLKPLAVLEPGKTYVLTSEFPLGRDSERSVREYLDAIERRTKCRLVCLPYVLKPVYGMEEQG